MTKDDEIKALNLRIENLMELNSRLSEQVIEQEKEAKSNLRMAFWGWFILGAIFLMYAQA